MHVDIWCAYLQHNKSTGRIIQHKRTSQTLGFKYNGSFFAEYTYTSQVMGEVKPGGLYEYMYPYQSSGGLEEF
jgi:hypothetical protein